MDELNEGGVSLSNFSLDDFRMDLLNFIEANRKELEAAPLGIYALVPYKLDSTLFKSGCFGSGKTRSNILLATIG